MKFKSFFIYALLGASVLLVGCDDKDEKKEEEKEPETNWSDKTVQQNKESIEAEGMKMLDEMKAMEEEPAMETNAAFMSFLDMADPFEGEDEVKAVNLKSDYIFRVNYALSDYNGQGLSDLFKSISVTTLEEDPETVQAMYDELVGVYSWNATIEDWDYTETGDVIKFEFPSTEDGTTNDASYTITFVGYTGTVLDPELEGNLPTSASAVLAVADAVQMGVYIDVAYDGEGYPTSIETSLVVGGFTMTAAASNINNADFDASYSFTHNSDILLKLELGAGGNWTEENIDAKTKYYIEYWDDDAWEWVEVEVTENEDWDYMEVEAWKVVTDGNASFQAMNLKIDGQIEIEELGNFIDGMEYEDYGETEAQAEADAINQYVTLALKFADTEEVIAMGEAYVKEGTDWEWVYDESTDTWEEIEVVDYDLDMRFVFADQSPIDLETYFETGFDDLINDLEEFVEELEDTYDLGYEEEDEWK